MAQQVDVKGFGLVEFPDGISRETMLQALQRRFSQMPTNESGATVAPYMPSLSERAASGVSNVLQRTGLVSNPYQANRIGGNVETALNFLPVIGDAIGGDDLGRALAQGDAGDIGFAALGAIPIAGDAVKGARKIKLFHGTNADFDDFDTSKIGSASDPGIRGRGFYFTPNKKTAESYGDKIKEVEVEVENPLDLQQFSSAKEVSEYLGVPESIIRFRVDKLPSGEFKSVSVSPNYTGSFTSAIKDKGHDAVIHGQEVVIFNPDKIKTLKTYDKLNPQQNPLTQVGDAAKDLRGGKVITSVSDLFDYTPDMLARQLKESDPSKVVGDVWRDQKRAFYTDYLPDGSAAMYKNDGALIKRMEADEARNLYRNRILEIEMQKPEAQAILEQRRLADEAASKAQQQASESDYRMMHRAPTRDGNPTADDLSTLFDDIYGPNALRLNSTGAPYDRKAIQLIQSMRGNPEKEITIYRAVPKGVTDINQGDWVTATKEYAEQHAKYDPNYVVISKKVRAKDIATDGNSIHEFGYDPQQ